MRIRRPLFRLGSTCSTSSAQADCAGSCGRQQQGKHDDKNETQVHPVRFVDHGDEILLLEHGKRKNTQLIADLATLINAKASPRGLRLR